MQSHPRRTRSQTKSDSAATLIHELQPQPSKHNWMDLFRGCVGITALVCEFLETKIRRLMEVHPGFIVALDSPICWRRTSTTDLPLWAQNQTRQLPCCRSPLSDKTPWEILQHLSRSTRHMTVHWGIWPLPQATTLVVTYRLTYRNFAGSSLCGQDRMQPVRFIEALDAPHLKTLIVKAPLHNVILPVHLEELIVEFPNTSPDMPSNMPNLKKAAITRLHGLLPRADALTHLTLNNLCSLTGVDKITYPSLTHLEVSIESHQPMNTINFDLYPSLKHFIYQGNSVNTDRLVRNTFHDCTLDLLGSAPPIMELETTRIGRLPTTQKLQALSLFSCASFDPMDKLTEFLNGCTNLKMIQLSNLYSRATDTDTYCPVAIQDLAFMCSGLHHTARIWTTLSPQGMLVSDLAFMILARHHAGETFPFRTLISNSTWNTDLPKLGIY